MDISKVMLPPNTVQAVAMHCGVNGHNKDWIGCLCSDGTIHTFWGPANKINQSGQRFGDVSTWNKLVNSKTHSIGSPYIIVDETLLVSGKPMWKSQVMKQGHPKPNTTIPKAQVLKSSLIAQSSKPSDALDWDF
jgi:hypothetical protein